MEHSRAPTQAVSLDTQGRVIGRGRSRAVSVSVPDLPGRMAACVNLLELSAVLERVHGPPDPIVLLRRKLPLLNKPLKRLLDKFLARADVVEDLASKDKVSAVDAN